MAITGQASGNGKQLDNQIRRSGGQGVSYRSLGPGRPFYLFGFVKCARSHNGAAWAVKLGYKNVYRYSGGIFAWKGAGYKAEAVK